MPMVPLALILIFVLASLRSSVSTNSSSLYHPKKEPEEISPNGLLAEITSCAGCRLSSYKAAQTFLVDGHAESYKGVSVLFVDGLDPVMVVKEQQAGGQVRQVVELKEYKTLQELQDLMDKLGFQKRTRKELERYMSKKTTLQEKQDQENLERTLLKMRKLHQKKEEIAAKALKLMEDNLKKQQEVKV